MEHENTSERNLIGPQVAKFRIERGLTQDELATKCQVAGHDISRSTLAKIEAQIRCATDYDVYQIAKALKVRVEELLSYKKQ